MSKPGKAVGVTPGGSGVEDPGGVGVPATGVGEATGWPAEEKHPETASNDTNIAKIAKDLAIFIFIGRTSTLWS
jgi:hypothetical protein